MRQTKMQDKYGNITGVMHINIIMMIPHSWIVELLLPVLKIFAIVCHLSQ